MRPPEETPMPTRDADLATATRSPRPVHTLVDSPIGPLRLVARGEEITGLYMERQRHLPADEVFGERVDDAFDTARAQLDEYFAGDRTEFDLPLRLEGSDFQRRVWAALAEIPYGRTVSYGELAARLGSPGASRAVGLANGRNPIAVIVPCHRVVAADGSLGGYGGGLERKRYLLDLERGHLDERLF